MNDQEHWIKAYWRPAMAWSYAVICLFDFLVAPIMVMSFNYLVKGDYVQWDPITLKESGFYHMAMMAILGVAAWTRGLEKIKKTNSEEGDK